MTGVALQRERAPQLRRRSRDTMPSRLPERSRWGNAARSIVWLPAILSAITVYACAVNVPIWDEWSIADLLHQFDSSALTLHQLLGQHNEHRPFVPRIIQI